jgi:pentatricopeptide repeat protein
MSLGLRAIWRLRHRPDATLALLPTIAASTCPRASIFPALAASYAPRQLRLASHLRKSDSRVAADREIDRLMYEEILELVRKETVRSAKADDDYKWMPRSANSDLEAAFTEYSKAVESGPGEVDGQQIGLQPAGLEKADESTNTLPNDDSVPEEDTETRLQPADFEKTDEPTDAPPNSDAVPRESAKTRNLIFRKAFTSSTPFIRKEVERAMSSPWVPDPRSYVSPHSTERNFRHARFQARRVVGFRILMARFGVHNVPTFETIYRQLKAISVAPDGEGMVAMRVILPSSWAASMSLSTLKYIEPITGLPTTASLGPDHSGPSSIILRGSSTSLSRAVDELSRIHPSIKAFKLGSVVAFDYDKRQLWPAILTAPEAGASLSEDQRLWGHHERMTKWSDTPDEEIPKPETWTQQRFGEYVAKLVYNRHHLQSSTSYSEHELRALDKVKVDLIMQAFQDPDARPHITVPVLNLALNFLALSGGYRSTAGQLIRLSERYGLPTDTDSWNIMLRGYVANGDFFQFSVTLKKMAERRFNANTKTWLLFLELVQKVPFRRQVIASMYDLRMLDDVATCRRIAQIMVENDAYEAFRNMYPLKGFLESQQQSYGEDWFTGDARHAIIQELLRSKTPEVNRAIEVKELGMMESTDGQKMGLHTINYIVNWCVPTRDRKLALWALSRGQEAGLQWDVGTYNNVIRLAFNCNAPIALSITIIHAIVNRKVAAHTRPLLTELLTGTVHKDFWNEKPRLMFPAEILREHFSEPVPASEALPRLEKAILERYGDMESSRSLSTLLKDVWGITRVRVGEKASKDPWSFNMKSATKKKRVLLDGTFNPAQMVLPSSETSDASQHSAWKTHPRLKKLGQDKGRDGPSATKNLWTSEAVEAIPTSKAVEAATIPKAPEHSEPAPTKSDELEPASAERSDSTQQKPETADTAAKP